MESELKTTIKTLTTEDLDELKALIAVFEDVFEMEMYVRPDERHLQKLLDEKSFLAITAKVNDQVIAGLTLFVLDQYYTAKPLAYLYDLAVSRQYQRKGIGRKLIEFTTQYCRLQGFEEVFVQAEAVDDNAIEFYRSCRPTYEERVFHFTYRLDSD